MRDFDFGLDSFDVTLKQAFDFDHSVEEFELNIVDAVRSVMNVRNQQGNLFVLMWTSMIGLRIMEHVVSENVSLLSICGV